MVQLVEWRASSDENDGVRIESNSSIVTQAGGDISITGVGANAGEGIDSMMERITR